MKGTRGWVPSSQFLDATAGFSPSTWKPQLHKMTISIGNTMTIFFAWVYRQLSADSQPKLVGLVWGLASTQNRVNSRSGSEPWWQHHKYRPWYYCQEKGIAHLQCCMRCGRHAVPAAVWRSVCQIIYTQYEQSVDAVFIHFLQNSTKNKKTPVQYWPITLTHCIYTNSYYHYSYKTWH